MIIGLTGGIGSGKSTVAYHWEKRGASLVIADEIAREICLPGSPELATLVQKIGAEILFSNGTLHRKELARRMFSDTHTRRIVEAILHPAITTRVQQKFTQLPHPIVYEAPLLLEAGHDHFVDLVVVVTAPRVLRIRRTVRRDGIRPEEVRARMASQWTDAQRCARAHIVLHNDRSLQHLIEIADTCWDELIKLGTPSV